MNEDGLDGGVIRGGEGARKEYQMEGELVARTQIQALPCLASG